MLNAEPAVCAVGVAVLPLAVPGAADSPGSRTCNLVNAPALTVTAGLVSAVFDGSVTSETVTVREPAVLKRTEPVAVPATRATFAGRRAFASVLLNPRVAVTDD